MASMKEVKDDVNEGDNEEDGIVNIHTHKLTKKRKRDDDEDEEEDDTIPVHNSNSNSNSNSISTASKNIKKDQYKRGRLNPFGKELKAAEEKKKEYEAALQRSQYHQQVSNEYMFVYTPYKLYVVCTYR